jgi:hypothetical protein
VLDDDERSTNTMAKNMLSFSHQQINMPKPRLKTFFEEEFMETSAK